MTRLLVSTLVVAAVGSALAQTPQTPAFRAGTHTVSVYATVLGVMVVLAFGTAAICTAIGAAIFLASDTTIAWSRFVQPLQRGPLIIIVTYHVAQVLILLGLAR